MKLQNEAAAGGSAVASRLHAVEARVHVVRREERAAEEEEHPAGVVLRVVRTIGSKAASASRHTCAATATPS